MVQPKKATPFWRLSESQRAKYIDIAAASGAHWTGGRGRRGVSRGQSRRKAYHIQCDSRARGVCARCIETSNDSSNGFNDVLWILMVKRG